MTRAAWTDLPAAIITAVTERTGPVLTAKDAPGGAGSDLATWLISDDTATFVKGARVDGEHHAPLRREAAIAPHLDGIAPRLLWQITVDDWDLLGYELLEGAQEWAWLEPGSPDIQLTADALTDVGRLSAPRDLPPAWERWGYWCDADDEELFRGDRLIHGDPAAVNFLIHEGRARIIDWAWAMRGPAWIDPMLWGGRLVLDGGHEPEHAAVLVRDMPGLYGASRRGLMTLAHAEAAAMRYAADEDGDPVTAKLADAAQAWANHWK